MTARKRPTLAIPRIILASGRKRPIRVIATDLQSIGAGKCPHCKRRGLMNVRGLIVECGQCHKRVGTLESKLELPEGLSEFLSAFEPLGDFMTGERAVDAAGSILDPRDVRQMKRAVRTLQTAERAFPAARKKARRA